MTFRTPETTASLTGLVVDPDMEDTNSEPLPGFSEEVIFTSWLFSNPGVTPKFHGGYFPLRRGNSRRDQRWVKNREQL